MTSFFWMYVRPSNTSQEYDDDMNTYITAYLRIWYDSVVQHESSENILKLLLEYNDFISKLLQVDHGW